MRRARLSIRPATVKDVATALAFAALASGCATIVPLQTASVVPRGGYRLSAQASFSPWCSISDAPTTRCEVPWAPRTPEVRLSARHGIGNGVDVGASAHGLLGALEGWRLGAFVDGKKELWSRELGPDRRQLISLGLGAGYTAQRYDTVTGAAENAQADLAAPLFFAHQTETVEWVGSVRWLSRFNFTDRGNDGRREHTYASEGGLAVGGFVRSGKRLGGELSYQAPLDHFGSGVFLLTVGFLFDIAPPEPEEAP